MKKFQENLSIGTRVVQYGQTVRHTDRHEENKSLFAILRTRLKTSGSLLYFKQAATGPYRVSDKSIPHLPILFVTN
jgi:hypothetical protein